MGISAHKGRNWSWSHCFFKGACICDVGNWTGSWTSDRGTSVHNFKAWGKGVRQISKNAHGVGGRGQGKSKVGILKFKFWISIGLML